MFDPAHGSSGLPSKVLLFRAFLACLPEGRGCVPARANGSQCLPTLACEYTQILRLQEVIKAMKKEAKAWQRERDGVMHELNVWRQAAATAEVRDTLQLVAKSRPAARARKLGLWVPTRSLSVLRSLHWTLGSTIACTRRREKAGAMGSGIFSGMLIQWIRPRHQRAPTFVT